MNLLRVTKGVCIHGVNCQGKLASGLALAIRNKYPRVYLDYIAAFNKRLLKPGYVIFTKITDDLFIASACTQRYYGRDKDVKYVSYDAIEACFRITCDFCMIKNLDLYYPKIGAGLGGGDWRVISAIIASTKPANLNGILCSM